MQEANNTNTKKKMQTLDAETGAIVLVTPENLQPETAITLETGFRQYFADAESLRRRSLAVVVKDADDRKGMQEAREVRLALRNVRVAAEKTRKAMKEESLRTGKAIDGLYNLLAYAVEPLEAQLAEKEEFAVRENARRMQALRDSRSAMLAGLEYSAHVDLATLTEEQFQGMLQDAKDLRELKLKREAEAEAARIAAEKAEAEERERIRLENEKLKAEAAAREAQMKAEREKAEAERKAAEEKARKERAEIEAKARAEAAAREAAEKEARMLREAEDRRRLTEAEELRAKQAAEKAAAAKAARAPDRQKFMDFAATVRTMQTPEAKTEEGKIVAADIAAKVANFATWIETQAAKL